MYFFFISILLRIPESMAWEFLFSCYFLKVEYSSHFPTFSFSLLGDSTYMHAGHVMLSQRSLMFSSVIFLSVLSASVTTMAGDTPLKLINLSRPTCANPVQRICFLDIILSSPEPLWVPFFELQSLHCCYLSTRSVDGLTYFELSCRPCHLIPKWSCHSVYCYWTFCPILIIDGIFQCHSYLRL